MKAGVVASALERSRLARSAEVYIVPPTLSTATNIRPDEIAKYACRFELRGEHLHALVDILNTSNITERPEAPWPIDRIDNRMLVAVHTENETQSYALEVVSRSDQPVIRGSLDGTKITAPEELTTKLKALVQGLPSVGHRPTRNCPQ